MSGVAQEKDELGTKRWFNYFLNVAKSSSTLLTKFNNLLQKLQIITKIVYNTCWSHS